eukprot:GEMP01022854.1.p1 GENE.GEMP01022854.1~~GEMP01022854.1.p1  ORF type:complete len:494 (+),score=105.92 GEMP01022854.1:113-1594(+)
MEDNRGLVFVKPDACVPGVIELVRKKAQDSSLRILREGSLDNLVVSVDRHYHAIASKAVSPVNELPVPLAQFEAGFGVSWTDVLKSGAVVTAAEAMQILEVDGDGMENLWRICKERKRLVKLGGGFYCGQVRENPPLYCFNGFYMAMRQKYAAAGSRIYYFVLEWSSTKLDWSAFRSDFVGQTDPKTSSSSSLRGSILANWKNLGLTDEPNVGDNAVRGSASPFEAWVEMQNWLKDAPDATAFGKALLEVVPRPILERWRLDPQVTYGHRSFPVTRSLFDAFEDMNSGDLLALANVIASQTRVERPGATELRAFHDQIAKLKEVPRTGWVRCEVNKVESVADHSYGVAMLSLVLGPLADGLNVDKMVKMALLHDLAEHEVGDLVVEGSLHLRDNVSREEKAKLETAAMRATTKILLRPDLLELWEEYEAGETREARFVKDVDKLEMLYQAAYYEKTQKRDLEDFYQSTDGKILNEVCKEQDELLRSAKRARMA